MPSRHPHPGCGAHAGASLLRSDWTHPLTQPLAVTTRHGNRNHYHSNLTAFYVPQCAPTRRNSSEKPFLFRIVMVPMWKWLGLLPKIAAQKTWFFNDLLVDVAGETDSAELPTTVRVEEVSVGGANVRARGCTRSAAQDELVAHEFPVVFRQGTGEWTKAGVGRVRASRPFPDIAEELPWSAG